MFEEFLQAARTIFGQAQQEGRLIRNPDTARLRAMAHSAGSSPVEFS